MSEELQSRINLLEKKALRQDKDIKDLTEKYHVLDKDMSETNIILKNLDKTQSEIKTRIDDHMEKEEANTIRIFDKLDSMDSELKDSFSKRDTVITSVQLENAKIGTKMLITGAALVVLLPIVVQVIIKVWF